MRKKIIKKEVFEKKGQMGAASAKPGKMIIISFAIDGYRVTVSAAALFAKPVIANDHRQSGKR